MSSEAALSPVNTPSHRALRTLLAFCAMVALSLFGLTFFPSIVLILLFTFAPAGIALVLAGPPVDRGLFNRNGALASLAGGLTGAAWIVANEAGERHALSVTAGAISSTFILTVMGAFGCFIVSKLLDRAAREPDRPRVRTLGEDDD